MRKLKLLLPVVLLLAICLVLPAAASQDSTAMTVYVDQASGLDTNDGLTEATAVKTIDAAYVLLSNGLADDGTGTIVLVSDYTYTFAVQKETISASVTSHKFTVVYTGKNADIGLLLYRSAQGYLQLPGPTRFENMKLALASGCNKFTTIYGAGVNGSLVIGKNVTTSTNADLRPSLAAVPYTSANSTANNGKPVHLEINSGDWRTVYAGSYANDARGEATVVLNGGSINKLAVIYNKVFTGNVNYVLNGGSVAELCTSAGNAAGTVTGDITVTVKGVYPDKVSNYGTVNGGKYFDLVADGVSLPAGDITFRNVTGGGSLTMDPGTTLNITGTVTGTTNIQFTDTPATGVSYVTAPEATADDAFTFTGTAATVASANGVKTWTSAGEYVFRGLVLTVDNSAYTVKLYSGLSGTTQITPTNTVTEDGITKYYFEGLAAGAYRTNVSRNGYYTINKVRVFTAEQMATETVLDVTTTARIFVDGKDAGYQSITVKEFSDAMMEMLNNKENAVWYKNYAQYLTTPVFAEGKKHQQTTQEEMESYIAGLDDENDHMYVYSIGKSERDGRDIPVVIFSLTDLSGAQTLEEAAALINANEKLTVHYQAQIHGNEPAGGEAALATIGRLDTDYGTQLLEKMNIYVIPRLNPDGAYDYVRIAPSGYNGNREMLMARPVEVQARHYVYNLFMPELAIDGHEYTVDNANNNQAYKDMMIAGGYNGNSGEAFATFTEDMIMQIVPDLKANGLDFSYYTNVTNNNYSASGTIYAGLRGSVSFLLESRGIAFGNHTMDRRVISHLVALESILDYAYNNTEAVQAASDAERQRIISSGKTYEDTDVLVVAHKQVSDERLAHVTTKYDYLTGELIGSINVIPKKNVADTTRVRPTAYVIPAGQEWTQDVLKLLELHNISYYFAQEGTAINLQQYLGTVEAVTLSHEQAVVFGKGAYVIPMNQSGALILTSLMEPDLQDEYFEETNSGITKTYGNFAQLGIIPAYGESFPIYRYIRDLNEEGKVDTTTASSDVTYKVYVSSTNGADTNDAYTEATAAATIERAFVQLDALMVNAFEGQEGTVVFLDLYELGTNSYTFPSHDYPVVLTSKTGAEGLTKAYLKDNGWFAFRGDVTLDNMTIQPSGGNDYYYIFANGHNLTVKETVNTAASPYGKYFTIAGGAYSNNDYSADATPVSASPNLTILGGTWKYVYASSYTGKLIGNPHLTIENATVLGMMPSYAATTQGHVYISLKNTVVTGGEIYMGNANKNNLSNCTLTLGTGVDVDTIYTGSRDAGNVSKNATIIVDGADMTNIQVIRGANNTTGTVGKNVFAYKSGTVGPIVGYDQVQVYVDGSFHSITVAMTKLSLDPSKTGFGYKAEFTADETVKNMLVSQGYSLWLTEDLVVQRAVSDFREQLTLRLKNFDVKNYGEAKVNAKVSLTLNNGLTIETEVYAYSMRDMVELVAEKFDTFNSTQQKAVYAMCNTYAEAMMQWSIDAIRNWTAES